MTRTVNGRLPICAMISRTCPAPAPHTSIDLTHQTFQCLGRFFQKCFFLCLLYNSGTPETTPTIVPSKKPKPPPKPSQSRTWVTRSQSRLHDGKVNVVLSKSKWVLSSLYFWCQIIFDQASVYGDCSLVSVYTSSIFFLRLRRRTLPTMCLPLLAAMG